MLKMRLTVIFVVAVIVNVSSKPQVDLSRKFIPEKKTQQATQNSANAFQEALKNGVDLPTNLQNSLQTLQNNPKNGADLPNLSQVLSESPNVAVSGQNPLPSLSPVGQTLPNVAQNVSSLNQAAENLLGIPGNLPSSLSQTLPTNNVFPSGQLLPNLAQNLPVLNQVGQNPAANNLGQSGQLPTLTSIIPNIQNNLAQAQERLAQNLPQLPSTQSPLLNNLPSLLPNLNQFSQLPPLNRGGSLLQNLPQSGQRLGQNNLPSLQNLPSLTSAFGQNSPPQNLLQSAVPSNPTLSSGQNVPTSLLPTNKSSLMDFELEEENGSEVSEQRRGQVNNPANTKMKNRPLFSQTPQQNQPGGLLNNLHQFTDNQIQTTRDALRNSARNLLDLHKLRHQERRLLGQQQRLGGLLGNGGLSGGLSSPLGFLSGNPLETNENEARPTASGSTSGILGQNSQGLGLGSLGGLVGIGRK